jgi:hypothetical protein
VERLAAALDHYRGHFLLGGAPTGLLASAAVTTGSQLAHDDSD